jgi:hypothetical protein
MTIVANKNRFKERSLLGTGIKRHLHERTGNHAYGWSVRGLRLRVLVAFASAITERVLLRSLLDRLLKNTNYVIARSDFLDAAIYNSLFCFNGKLLRYVRSDGKKTFPTACTGPEPSYYLKSVCTR